ncbi:MAG: hypothetical protein COA60_009425 [Robiginitomaculum sp.]|nr:hypothetical protein [Robiginitomaculum sp.]
MSVELTVILLVLSVAITGFAVWRDGIPRPNGKIYWFSWKPFFMIGLVLVIIFITHLVNLAGIETVTRRR